MKIIFLCSCLEPGRDGAGDQALRLCAELIRQGHEANAIAISDHFSTNPAEEIQAVDGCMIHVLRLPSALKAQERYALAGERIKKINPDWVSLQFVSTGFHRYGLPLEIIFHLPSIIGKAKFHIMFQELWCGMNRSEAKKIRFLGKLQKLFIRIMISRLKPRKVFTNNDFFKDALKKIGVKASLAPVFGNISPHDTEEDERFRQLLEEREMTSLFNSREDWLVLTFFGTIYSCPGLRQLIANAAIAAGQVKRKLGILVVGQNRGLQVPDIIVDIANIRIWQTGMVSPGIINRLLKAVDLGVITTPAVLINKSSSAGTLLERGIPVVIPSQKEINIFDLQRQGIYTVSTPQDILQSLGAKGKFPQQNSVTEVAGSYSLLSAV